MKAQWESRSTALLSLSLAGRLEMSETVDKKR